jgi:hypothetical protein
MCDHKWCFGCSGMSIIRAQAKYRWKHFHISSLTAFLNQGHDSCVCFYVCVGVCVCLNLDATFVGIVCGCGCGCELGGCGITSPCRNHTSQHKPTPQLVKRIPFGHQTCAQPEFSSQAVVLACVGLCLLRKGLVMPHPPSSHPHPHPHTHPFTHTHTNNY